MLARFPGLLILRGLTVRNATTLLFIVVVGLIYYFVPNAKVRFRDVWIGALVTGLLWKGALEGFSWYMRDMTRFTRVNGSIAAVVVFLVWVYVQAVILLYGVEFTAAYARLRRGRPDEVPAAADAANLDPRGVRSSDGPKSGVVDLGCQRRERSSVASARMIASLNTGTSSGLREVIRLPSSTTGLST